jgi:DNA-binding winged helix-turn-helix (wHTH) protein/Tol biopolymer transport system component
MKAAMPSQLPHLLEFGRFRLDRTERLLFQDGAALPLSPRLFDTLLILVENRGHLVEKNHLMQKVWTDVAVEDNNLAQSISALRKILGDDLADPRFIETIPKRGYRFIATVKDVVEDETGDEQPGVTNLNDGRQRIADPSKRSFRIRSAIKVGIGLAVLVGLALIWSLWTGLGRQLQLKETQLTTNSSEASVIAVAISPDDKYLAFADIAGLYVRVIRTGETHPISVPPSSIIAGLSWFPDGARLLATVTGLQTNVDTVWLLSILGQSPVKLLEGGSQAAVSPEGSQIVFVRGKGRELWLMAANGESPHRILAAAEKETLSSPVWDWDGKHLVYGRVLSDMDRYDITIERLDLETGKTIVSFSDPDITSGVTLPDGRIVYSRNEVVSGQSGGSLMEANTDPRSGKVIGKPRQIARWAGSSISGLGVSNDGKHVVALRGLAQADAYVGDIVEHRLVNPRRLTFNDRDDFPSDWTPDSRYVLFASNRNGSFDIFRQARDERTAEALVSGPEDKLSLHLTPDGQWLMYFAFPGGYAPTREPLLMRAPLSGGPPQFLFKARPASDFRCLKAPATRCVLSEWENQLLVFFDLDPVRGKGRELVRQEIVSGPDAVESRWDLSPDGSHIAVAMLEGFPARIRLLSLTGGAAQEIAVAGWPAFQSIEWAADGQGWYAASRSAAANTLLFVDQQGHAFPLRHTPSGYDTYAVPSPDRHHLAFLEYTTANNAWMIENF